ncbi:MAG: M48 family metallopeptidase [bacterium]
MKKFFVLLMFLFISNSFVWAYDVDFNKEGQYQKKVMEMGFGILNANRIEKRIIFRYQGNKIPNAYADSYEKSVIVLKGLMPYMDDDSELAGILSHEIAHNIDYYEGFWRCMAMAWSPQKYEEKADKKAVDYMVKAGYDPVAMIIVLNKICGQSGSSTHPVTLKRLAYIYEYIYQKYPAYLADNQYKTNLYYQNFLLTSKKEREKIRDKNLINVSNKSKKIN